MGNEEAKMKNKRRLAWQSCVAFFFIFPFFIFSSCGPDRCDTPFGEGGTIDIAFLPALNNVGGSQMINRGYKGIMVTRMSYSDFVAFECACPNDHEVCLQPDNEWGNNILTCPVCASSYNALDGSPLDGAVSPCPLYQYNTIFDGQNLTIY